MTREACPHRLPETRPRVHTALVMVTAARWDVRFFLFTCSNGAGEGGM